MKKITLLTVGILLLFMQMAIAQTAMKGRVTETDGDPISGATIKVKGTNRGTTSDNGGNFGIVVKEGDILIVSGIGYKKTEVAAEAGLVVKLIDQKTTINEVVVTAFGVKREKKALGYATTQIKAEQLTQGANGNVVNALSGKVAGLTITSSAGTPGAASKIQLRGATTLTGTNSPIFVVDGMIIDNSSSSSGDPDEGKNAALQNVTNTSRGLDINPDDIAEVSVLKGPAAAALYGSLAANGVILITTKKGNGKRGIGVSYNTSVTFDQVNKMPELQNQFLQGRAGKLGIPTDIANQAHRRESWGPSADTMFRDGQPYLWDNGGYIVGKSDPSKKTPFTPYDNVSKFFKTARTINNNLSLVSSNDKSSLRFSFGNLNQDGIIYNSNFKRNTVGLNVETRATDKLLLGASANFALSNGQFVQQGSNLSGIMLGLMRTPMNFDNSNGLSDASDRNAYMFADGNQRTFRGTGIYDNPYYTINQNLYTEKTNRLFGNIFATYEVNSWLSITDRIGTDMYNTTSQQNFGKLSGGLAGTAEGRVAIRNVNYNHVNNDLFVNIKPNIKNSDIDLNLMLGNNYYNEYGLTNYQKGDNLVISEWYNINNAKNFSSSAEEDYSLTRLSQFASAKAGYKNYVFAEVTGRFEQSSTYLPASRGNNFYPSASVSAIITDALDIKSDKLTYAKVRLSYAKVGRNPSAQSTINSFAKTLVNDGWTDGIGSPFGGANPIFEQTTLKNPNLKPEITNSFEIGTELKFLDNKISLDYTYYMNNSYNLLMSVPVSPSSGSALYYTNAGAMTNRGHEVQLSLIPIRKRDLKWEVNINFATNRNNVTKLADGVNFLDINGFEGSQVGAKVNNPYGVFYGSGYLRDSVSGKMLIDDDTASTTYGFPMLDPNQKVLGNTLPRWTGGLNNSITYKGINLSFLFETRQGGIIWNGTRGALASFGTAAETANRNTETKTFDGAFGHYDANGKLVHYDANMNEVAGLGSSSNKAVPLNEAYYRTGIGSGFNINEPFVESASWTRLREVSISYSLPSNLLTRTKFIKGATFGLVGRNLLLWTKYKGVDPETSLTGNGNSQGIDYFNNPGTKTYGINLKLNF
jgi:TonB-linked SusC/RagA family outer membrane protein